MASSDWRFPKDEEKYEVACRAFDRMSPHASDGLEALPEARVSAPSGDIPYSEYEDEEFERLMRLAGCAS